jgi:uncharacterized protein
MGRYLGNPASRFESIAQTVRKELSSSSHDFEHVMRVHRLCLLLAEDAPNVSLDVLRTAALLHDIGRVREDKDNSGNTDHASVSAQMAETILRGLGDSDELIKQVKHCILSHRFRSSVDPGTDEARILFDADKLDAIGAVGIARCFMLAGEYRESIFSDKPLDDYVRINVVDGKSNGRIKDISKHAPNLEFEIKLRHIPEKLHTKKAKTIANDRVRVMDEFFKRLRDEISGDIL